MNEVNSTIGKIKKFVSIGIVIFIFTWFLFLFHESGHYIASLLVGCKTPAIHFVNGFPQNTSINIDENDLHFKTKVVFITLMGDLAGLVPITGLIYVLKESKKELLFVAASYFMFGCSSDLQLVYKVLTNQF